MAGYVEDLARFGYGGAQTTPYDTVNALPTPFLTGGGGNAIDSYLRTSSTLGGASPLAPNVGAGIAGLQTNFGSGFPTAPGGYNPGSSGLGFNIDTGRLLLGGIGTLGSLWTAWQANKLAKEQFKFSKDITNTNLANQISAYNTTLEDRIRSRAVTEGMSDRDAQSYIDTHKLAPRQV